MRGGGKCRPIGFSGQGARYIATDGLYVPTRGPVAGGPPATISCLRCSYACHVVPRKNSESFNANGLQRAELAGLKQTDPAQFAARGRTWRLITKTRQASCTTQAICGLGELTAPFGLLSWLSVRRSALAVTKTRRHTSSKETIPATVRIEATTEKGVVVTCVKQLIESITTLGENTVVKVSGMRIHRSEPLLTANEMRLTLAAQGEDPSTYRVTRGRDREQFAVGYRARRTALRPCTPNDGSCGPSLQGPQRVVKGGSLKRYDLATSLDGAGACYLTSLKQGGTTHREDRAMQIATEHNLATPARRRLVGVQSGVEQGGRARCGESK